jgi:hypothetical protein
MTKQEMDGLDSQFHEFMKLLEDVKIITREMEKEEDEKSAL